MQSERLVALARDTSASDLCEAWKLHHKEVEHVKSGKRPMTIREVGALAELHGMLLGEVLAI